MIANEKTASFTERINKGDEVWVYFYTPLCGTCDLARSFLEMTEKVSGRSFIYDIDLNYYKQEAAHWEIKSVPCLVKFKNNVPEKKLYAFKSVSNVYDFIFAD